MNIDLPPQYDPKSVEQPTYQSWLQSGVFHAVPDAPGAAARRHFSIVIPPPNVTGALHLGHALNGTIQDILTRYHRMKGDNTMWMPGVDHAGIATQAIVERTIFEKEGKNRHDLGREELVRRIWEWKQQYGDRIISQQQALGVSCDWDRTRFTLDDICAKAVREAFFKMFKDGLIFRGKRLVNWDTHLQTAVADDEIYRETVRGQMTSIRYPIEQAPDSAQAPGSNPGAFASDQEFLIVATTRPETMLGDTAVAVHPDDPRYKHLIGKHVIIPLVGRKIPIIADGLLVDPKFGTGVVKVTPAHDPNDYATGQRHKLEQINLLTPDGKVNENGAGEFLGKKYSYTGLRFATAARKQVLADLEALELIAEAKPHEHEVGHSDRSKTPIEPYLSDQWFVRMGDGDDITLADGAKKSGLAQAAMDAVIEGRVKITPDRYAKSYLDWLSQKRDWCISRQLWWGHRIPVWSGSKPIPGLDHVFANPTNTDTRHVVQIHFNGVQISYSVRRDPSGTPIYYWCVPPGNPEIERVLEGCGYAQDPDVLDTWFSSALWPISTMGWPANGTSDKPEDQILPEFYPTSVLSTAREILTLWVARMVMFGLYCKGDVPFRDVYIHPVIQDGEGRQMSKSKGNGVDPVDVIHSHGADALRFTLAQMTTETQDIRMPVQVVCPHCAERFPNPSSAADKMNCPKCKQPLTRALGTAVGTIEAPLARTTSDRFDLGRNFANKIWNATRFILGEMPEDVFSQPVPTGLMAMEDRWILSRLNAVTGNAAFLIDAFRFSDLANSLYQFFWSDLCDWYLEISKSRRKAGDKTVQAILLHCLETSLKLLHPVMPYITEEIWGKLPSRTQMLVQTPWPVPRAADYDAIAEWQMGVVQQITSAVRDLHNNNPGANGKDVVIRTATADIQKLIEASRGIIEPLVGAKLAEVSMTAAKPADAATKVTPEAEIYIGGAVDRDAEKKKLAKRKEDLLKFIAGNKGKLDNQGFVAKAPEKVVQGLRDQLASQEAELAAVEKNLAELNG